MDRLRKKFRHLGFNDERPASRTSSPELDSHPGQSSRPATDPGGLIPGQTRGLRVLRDPPESSIDIIFIHGLKGDSHRTWLHQASGIHWPTDLLPRNLPEARILTFGYDADFLRFFDAGKGTLRTHANALIYDYAALRRQDCVAGGETETGKQSTGRAKRVIIVAHSLGGLVAKKALCISSEFSGGSEKLLDSEIAGVLFLGTPHMGSDLAEAGSMALKFLKLFGERRMNTAIVKLLQPGSELLGDVHSSFARWLQRNGHTCSIACFLEEHETPGLGMVVPHSSAVLAGYPEIPIPSHHRDMTKFSGEQDVGYARVLGQINQALSKAHARHAESSNRTRRPSISIIRQDSEYKACFRDLCFPTMAGRYDRISYAADETCEWLAKHPTYVDWATSGTGTLWLLGHPGTGKSTLMKHAVQGLMQQSKSRGGKSLILSFFFYDLGTELQKSKEGMLRTVLSQLLQAFPLACEPLMSVYDNLGHGSPGATSLSKCEDTTWASSNLMGVLEECIMHVLQHAEVYLFIDALDECRGGTRSLDDMTDEARGIVKELRRITRKLGTLLLPHGLRICYSCRHYPHIASTNDGARISVEKETSGDIREYLTQELSTEIAGQHSLLESLVDSISGRAMGSFQWVNLVTKQAIKMHHAGKNAHRIMEHVGDLHNDLSALYKSILSSVNNEDRPRALRLFQWACFAPSPIATSALRLMMNVDLEQSSLSLERIKNHPDFIENDLQMERLVLSLSGGLAILNKTSNQVAVRRHLDGPSIRTGHPMQPDRDVENINDGWVQVSDQDHLSLIHQSVKDFMIREGFQILYGSPVSRSTIVDDAWETMAISYTSVITMEEFIMAQKRIYARYYPGTAPRITNFIYCFTNSGFPAVELSPGDDPSALGRSETDTKAEEECQEFFKRLLDRTFIRRHRNTGLDIALFRRRMSRVYISSPTEAKGILAQIHSLLEWNNQLAEHGLGILSMFNFLHHVSTLPPPLRDRLDARIASLLTRAAFQDLTTSAFCLSFALGHDLPGIFRQAWPLVDNSESNMRAMKYGLLAGAARAGSYNVVMVLLEGPWMSCEGVPVVDQLALVNAAAYGHAQIADLLIKHGADIHQRDDYDNTVLYWAALNGWEDMCRILLEKGADVDCITGSGNTALMAAAHANSSAIFDLLLRYSPDPNTVNEDGESALTFAFGSENMHITRTLLFGSSNLAEPVKLDELTTYALALRALDRDDAEFCRLLIDCKGIDYLESLNINAARAASLSARSCVAPFLDAYNQDVNRTCMTGRNALMWAVLESNVSLVAMLLDRPDVDVNHVIEGRTPLANAVTIKEDESYLAVVSMLLGHPDFDPNVRPSDDTAALHWTIMHQMLEGRLHESSPRIALLLTHPEIDPNIRDGQGWTPLMLAAYYGCSEIVRQLLKHSLVQPDLKTDGRSALSMLMSIEKPQHDIAQSTPQRAMTLDAFLERADVDINSQDRGGYTPLNWAIGELQCSEKEYRERTLDAGSGSDKPSRDQHDEEDGNGGRGVSGESVEADEIEVKGRGDGGESARDVRSEGYRDDGDGGEKESKRLSNRTEAEDREGDADDPDGLKELEARRIIIETLRARGALRRKDLRCKG